MAHKQIYIVDGRRVDPHGNPVDDQDADNSGEREVVSTAEATEPDAMTFSDEVSTVNPEPRRRFQREEDAIEELMTVNGIGEEIARVLVRKGVMNRDDLRRMDDDVLRGVPGIGNATLKRIRKQLEE